MKVRVGFGFDVHRLKEGRPCIIGGVEIPNHFGPDGHSDADVLLHAITDAVLGAAGLGDIGRLFPDDDPTYRGADSAVLLREAMQRVRAHGWQLVNLDCTVVAQAPRLSGHMPAIVQRVADCLSIPTAQVNVKAKTAERLGPVGQGHSIEARAVVLLAHV
ncbi:MAG: 2-C-methyl-D-erythritol 2,4-cyclodiphosphate synthase [Limnohabitans sp.]